MHEQHMDMTGCYVFTAVGRADAQGGFMPDPSMLKMRSYGVPNTLHEIYLSDVGMRGQYDIETLKRSLVASVGWMMDNIRGDHGGRPGVLVNIVDGCDALANQPERTCDMLELIASLPVQGISIEDDRGTFLPFQVGACVAMARTCLPRPLKILVHLHAGGGFENAAAIEALLNGADGAWGGLPKQAALIGHASLGELIANLLRLGNRNIAQRCKVDGLLPLVRRLQAIDGQQPPPDDVPVLGGNAYRLTMSAFEQIHGRPMDLPPDRIGGHYGYRVCPVVSDPRVVAGRLAEVTGVPSAEFPGQLIDDMIRLMRREQRAGLRIAYDEPENLLGLYARTRRMA
jgi:hypothetical protein